MSIDLVFKLGARSWSFAASELLVLSIRFGVTWELVRKRFGSAFRVVSLPVFSIELFDIHILNCSWIETTRINTNPIWM